MSTEEILAKLIVNQKVLESQHTELLQKIESLAAVLFTDIVPRIANLENALSSLEHTAVRRDAVLYRSEPQQDTLPSA